jgi:hypothetical protein
VLSVPDGFAMLLESMLTELGALDLKTLHEHVCDPNSSPALRILIQVTDKSRCPE